MAALCRWSSRYSARQTEARRVSAALHPRLANRRRRSAERARGGVARITLYGISPRRQSIAAAGMKYHARTGLASQTFLAIYRRCGHEVSCAYGFGGPNSFWRSIAAGGMMGHARTRCKERTAMICPQEHGASCLYGFGLPMPRIQSLPNARRCTSAYSRFNALGKSRGKGVETRPSYTSRGVSMPVSCTACQKAAHWLA